MKKIIANTIAFLLIGLFAAGLSSCSHEHAFTDQVILKNPTCTEPGVGYFVCPEDGTRTQDLPIPALGHHVETKTIAPTCTEDGYDVHFCTRCGEELSRDNYVEAPGHDYIVTVVPPTCTEKGYSIYECTHGDDRFITDYVSPLGHKYVKSIVAPTCVDEGYTVHQCSRCGDTYYDDYVEPLGHDIVHHDALRPTCTEHGHEAYDTCSRCDYSTYADIPAHGHRYRKTVYAPSCTESGHTHYLCLVCGEEHDGDYVKALGHDYSDYPALDATCDSIGHKAYHVCSRCGDSNYEELPALGLEHEYMATIIEPTVDAQGYTLHVCNHCASSYKTDFVAPLKITQELDGETAIEETIHPEERVYSRRDDDYYFYAVYLGHVSDFVFHNIYEFVWSEGMEALGTYPKEPNLAKPMDVLEKYQDKQRVWSESIGSTLLNSIPFTPKGTFQAIYSDSPEIDASTAKVLSANFEGEPLEFLDPSLSSLTNKINAIESAYVPGENPGLYEEGVRYSYAAVADLDLYVGVIYDIANETFRYKPCSVLKSEPKEILLASTDGSFDIDFRPLDVSTLASAGMSVPSAYETNHPLKTFSYAASKINVVIAGSGTITYSSQSQAVVDLMQNGYDRVCFDVKMTANCGGIFGSDKTNFGVQICNNSLGALNSEYRYDVYKRGPSNYSFRLYAYSSLCPDGIFKFYTVWHSGWAYDVTATITTYYFNQTAQDLGAYAGSPIA